MGPHSDSEGKLFPCRTARALLSPIPIRQWHATVFWFRDYDPSTKTSGNPPPDCPCYQAIYPNPTSHQSLFSFSTLDPTLSPTPNPPFNTLLYPLVRSPFLTSHSNPHQTHSNASSPATAPGASTPPSTTPPSSPPSRKANTPKSSGSAAPTPASPKPPSPA